MIYTKYMHIIQEKILKLAKKQDLTGLTLRKLGELVGEPGSPQKIKHHLDRLVAKGLLLVDADGKSMRPASSGLDEKSKIASLPIVGSANCGEALTCADQKVEEYMKISVKLLGDRLANKLGDLYVLRAVGNSMNRADINGKSVDDGDYLIVDKTRVTPMNGEYVVSIIGGLANIKKFLADKNSHQVILISESSQNIAPIYIHEDDYADYLVCGRVVDVIKKPDELAAFRQASYNDILKDLGPISKEEVDYYENL